MTADRCGYEAIAYEFVVQSFTCYEDEISDSKAQFAAITYIVSALQQFTCFGKENYDTLISKATQHSAKLLKKTDQCRAVAQCSHLFWPGDDKNVRAPTLVRFAELLLANKQPGHRDEKRVLACLQRSLKIANSCMGSQVHLFVEILNKYLFFYDRNCPSVNLTACAALHAAECCLAVADHCEVPQGSALAHR